MSTINDKVLLGLVAAEMFLASGVVSTIGIKMMAHPEKRTDQVMGMLDTGLGGGGYAAIGSFTLVSTRKKRSLQAPAPR